MSDFVLCEECSKKLSGNDVVYRNHGYADYYCTIDCLKSRVFQESVNEL